MWCFVALSCTAAARPPFPLLTQGGDSELPGPRLFQVFRRFVRANGGLSRHRKDHRLNQVEVWFSILQGQSLSGTSFTSLKQLQEHIDAYINAYNDKAEPFVWTKKKVRQRRFKGRRITQF